MEHKETKLRLIRLYNQCQHQHAGMADISNEAPEFETK